MAGAGLAARRVDLGRDVARGRGDGDHAKGQAMGATMSVVGLGGESPFDAHAIDSQAGIGTERFVEVFSRLL